MEVGQLATALATVATVAGASRVVGVPRSTIRSAIDRGELEVYHLGDGTTVIDLGELRAWNERRAKNSEKN